MSGPFKMKGWSPFTDKTKREEKRYERRSKKIADLEDKSIRLEEKGKTKRAAKVQARAEKKKSKAERRLTQKTSEVGQWLRRANPLNPNRKRPSGSDPAVRRSDLDKKGKEMWDALRRKKK